MLYIQISIMASFDGVVLPLVKQDFCLCRSFLGLTCSRPGYKLAIKWLQASHGALKGVVGAICPATTREHHTYAKVRDINSHDHDKIRLVQIFHRKGRMLT